MPQAGYLRGEPGRNVLLNTPRPVLRDRKDDIRSAWLDANGRANDALLNSGWIAGVVEQVIALMIGAELRLNAKPNMTAFGWDDTQTAEWARLVERRWAAWTSQPYECDLTGRYTLGQQQAAAIRQWFATGEVVSEIAYRPRPGAETGTKVRLIPSHWISQRTDAFNGVFQGVRMNRDGLPTGYVFETRDERGFPVTVEKRARDPFGRPQIVHVFDGVAGQVRGITPLAPALKVVRQFDQLADATLTAAMIHAIFAATIESDYPTAEVMAALQDQDEATSADPSSTEALAGAFYTFMKEKVGWHENVDIDLGRHGKIAHLLMGEKLKLQGSEHPNSTYESFANFLLREVASCLGVMFEDLTGDYRGATYSSVRMGIAKKWPLMEYRRRVIPGRFTQSVYEAWLEEEIDAARIPIPGGIDAFVANRTSICRSDWRGPPKPQADDAKAAKAHDTWYRMGVLSQEDIANDLGMDIDDVHERLQREQESRERRGLPHPISSDVADDDDEEDPDDRSNDNSNRGA